MVLSIGVNMLGRFAWEETADGVCLAFTTYVSNFTQAFFFMQ
jgi:hypothetical protein